MKQKEAISHAAGMMQTAQNIMLDQGYTHPMFEIHSFGDGPTKRYLTPWESAESKRGVFSVMAVVAIAEDAECLVVFSETWMASNLPPGVQPSQSDTREESVTVWCSYFDDDGERQGFGSIVSTQRDPTTGKISGFKDVATEPMGGDMTMIFPTRRATPEAREKAQALMRLAGIKSGGTRVS